MFAIIVTEKGGDQRRLEFDKSEVTIGRVQGNDIVLPAKMVSRRHCRVEFRDGQRGEIPNRHRLVLRQLSTGHRDGHGNPGRRRVGV